MNTVVYCISRNDESDGRRVHARGIVGVGVPKLYDDEPLSLKVYLRAVKSLCADEMVGDLIRKARLPKTVEIFGRNLAQHCRGDLGRCQRFGIREAIQ